MLKTADIAYNNIRGDVMYNTFYVLLHAEDGGYWAEVTNLPGCCTQGDTIDEIKNRVREAIEGMLNSAVPDMRLILSYA